MIQSRSTTLIIAIVCTLQANAQLTLSPMFGDHMVLSSANSRCPSGVKPIPVSPITVRFAGHEVETRAAQDGRWMLQLPAMPASAEGREFFIESDGTTKRFQDVFVGEVWIYSGQSNMQYGWGKQSQPRYNWGGDADLAQLAEAATGLPIRTFDVPTNVSFTPSDDCAGQWSTDIPGSAIAFGFSYHLHKSLNVPVAAIVTCQ